jgi:hypothetical protein
MPKLTFVIRDLHNLCQPALQAGMVDFIGTALAHPGSRALKRSARPKQMCVCGLSFRLQ